VWRMIGASPDALRRRARALARRLVSAGVDATVRPDESAVGGGSLPGVTLPTWVVAVNAPAGASVDALAGALRRGEPALVGRIAEDLLLLDLRTLLPGDEAQIVRLIPQVSRGILDSVRN
ncbi:MAG: L-seryl-tRNA(Sec) selenium transferase, partial [Chloroflexota bacterium]